MKKAAQEALEALGEKHQKTLLKAYGLYQNEVTLIGFWWTDRKKNFRGQNPLGYPPSIEDDVVAKFREMGVFIPLNPTKPNSTLMCNPDVWRYWEALKEGPTVPREFDPDDTQEIPMTVFPYLDRIAAEIDSEESGR